MKPLHVKATESFETDPFQMIGKDWMLITAEKDHKVNAMTAAWGGLGVIWNKKVAFLFVRKSRYTKEFLDRSDGFSLAFFDTEKYRNMLSYMGTVSGRDVDKAAKYNLTVKHHDGIPYYNEAKMVLLCKKLCCQPLLAENFCDKETDAKWYADKDYHDLYIGEIIKVLNRE